MTRVNETSGVIGAEAKLPPVPPMVFVGEDGRIVGINAVAENFFGYSIGQLDGVGIGEMLLEAGSRELVAEALEKQSRGEWVEISDRPKGARAVKADGASCAVLLSMSVVHTRAGKELAFAFHAADSAPGQSRLLRRLIDAIPDNLFIKDTENRIVINNAAHARHLGMAPEGCVGKTDRDFFPSNLAESFIAVEKHVVEEGVAMHKEEESIDRMGKRRWVRTSKVPLKDETGRVIGLAGVNHDITAEKMGQEALAASEERHRTLYHNTPVMLHSVDADGTVVHVSDYWLNCLGYAREEVVGEASWRFYSEASRKELLQNIFPALGRTGRINDVPLEVVRKDGRVVAVEVSAIAQYDLSGKMIGGLAVSIDVTERREAEAEREKLHQQLVEVSRHAGMAEVATGVLHNVGNVLNSVNVSTCLLNDRIRGLPVKNLARAVELMTKHAGDLGQFISTDPQGTKLPGYLATVATAFQKEETALLEELAALGKNVEHIKEIVTFQQSYAKSEGMEENVDIGILLEQASRISISVKERAKISVACDVEKGLIVRTDKHAVLQILTNVLKNAQQSVMENPEGQRHIVVRAVKNAQGKVEVEVRDNGVGIESQNLTKIFCHGFTTKVNGHGFGLHTSANAAKRLGGSLEGMSEGVGKGAAFLLRLPVEGKGSGESGGVVQEELVG